MSQFKRIFGDGDYLECTKCNSLTKIDEGGRLMRMILNTQDIPVIYEEQNTDLFIDVNGDLKCNCTDLKKE